jgi:CRISPR-associated protein Cmr3
MKVKISALDTLTFGVGKPSAWGEDSFGKGMFPPFPSVARGAMRAGWLYENGTADIADTEEDETKKCFISEYALLLNGEPYFPTPADYVLCENDKLKKCTLQCNDNLSNLKTTHQLWADDDGKLKPAEKRYITREALECYLADDEIKDSAALSDYISEENKIGIYRNRGTNTVKQGMLYNSPLKRLENGNNSAALVANFEGLVFRGLIRFGGESKVASFTEWRGNISPGLPDGAVSKDGNFKVYLATPAFFSGGYLPAFLKEENTYAKLLTAAIYGYESIGGFDVKKKCPKQMLRAVKAGSVYYCKLKENTEENRQKVLSLHGKSISEFYAQDGFGICYIGKYEEGAECTKM